MRRQDINRRLYELCAKHGHLSADIVIADARNESSPLHDAFEWNVEAAARRDWIRTAERLINGYRVEVQVETRTLNAPMFVRDVRRPKRFVSVDNVANERSLALATLQREADRVRAAIGRMQAIAAALGISDPVTKLDDALTEVINASAA